MESYSSQPSTSYWDMYLAAFDKWICTVCGAEFMFLRNRPGKRGGPSVRGLDPRHGFLHCWRGCRNKKGKQLVRHELAPNAKQPKQDQKLIKRLYEDKQPKEYAKVD